MGTLTAAVLVFMKRGGIHAPPGSYRRSVKRNPGSVGGSSPSGGASPGGWASVTRAGAGPSLSAPNGGER